MLIRFSYTHIGTACMNVLYYIIPPFVLYFVCKSNLHLNDNYSVA